MLVEQLKNKHPGVRCYAAEELGHIGDISVVPDLVELLQDDHQEVRASVARALGEINHQSALTALVGTLSDPVGSVRVWVAYAIEQIGTSNEAAIRGLISSLQDSEWFVRSLLQDSEQLVFILRELS